MTVQPEAAPQVAGLDLAVLLSPAADIGVGVAMQQATDSDAVGPRVVDRVIAHCRLVI